MREGHFSLFNGCNFLKSMTIKLEKYLRNSINANIMQ